MAFILGIWMWNRYFTPKLDYAPGTERLALVKIDRELRLADAMAGDPAWLRKMAGAKTSGEVAEEAMTALMKLEAWQAMGPKGAEAYVMIRAVTRGESVSASKRALSTGTGDEAAPEMSWWRAKELEESGATGWRENYLATLGTLRTRAIALSAGMAALLLAGLVFLPLTLKTMASGLKMKARGYAGAWTPALGLTVYMVAILAWIGYVGTLDLGIEQLTRLPPMMGLMLDTAARFLPALIALGFLFKRPSHVARVLGIDAKPDLRLVAGMFPLLLLAELLLRRILGNPGEGEPAGGLVVSDAGWIGLLFVVISACVVAPVTEEIVHRGVLFRSLANRLGVAAAAAVSAVVFSAIHFYDLHGFISVAVFGFTCALLYAGTRSLTTVIVLHVLYNASIKLPSWIFYHAPL